MSFSFSNEFFNLILVNKTNLFNEYFLEDFSIQDIEMIQSKVDNLFPKFYQFLIPNSSKSQTFIRDQIPSFADDISENSDNQFDIITLGKLSLLSNPTFRRCIRCSNYSRLFPIEPYPFLVYRLNNRCLCGGLFLHYTQ